MTIVTDSRGLITGAVQIPVGGHISNAYHAMPEGGKRVPIILVMHQIYGINDYSRDVCRRLAKAGYLAVLPDLYGRYGSTQGLSREEIAEGLAKAVEDRAVLQDMEAWASWAAATGGDATRLGVMGFAWGAQFVWLACAELQNCKAGVSWYGRLIRDLSPQRPTPWRDVVARLRAPVLGIYAGTDPHVSLDILDEMRRALVSAKVSTELAFYPEARHGFHADYQPQYRPADAEDGWKKQMEWFARHGVK
jgi:carboxymethylenebutenolidase